MPCWFRYGIKWGPQPKTIKTNYAKPCSRKYLWQLVQSEMWRLVFTRKKKAQTASVSFGSIKIFASKSRVRKTVQNKFIWKVSNNIHVVSNRLFYQAPKKVKMRVENSLLFLVAEIFSVHNWPPLAEGQRVRRTQLLNADYSSARILSEFGIFFFSKKRH